MRRLLLAFACMLFAGSAYGQTPIDVYIFAGQSNMVGFMGQAGLLPAGVLNPNPNILYSYKITGPTAAQLYQSASPVALQGVFGTGGAEMTFAQEVFERTDRKIGIIKVAANATSLHYDWNVDTPAAWYASLVEKVVTTRAQLTSAGYAPNLAGFFWTQGEGDANTSWQAVEYQQNLTELIEHLRTDVNVDIPVYLNRLNINLERNARDMVRAAQTNVAASVPNVNILNIDDLALGGDKIHFTAETHIEVGRRWADFIYPSGDFNYDNVVNDLDLAIWQATAGTTDMRGDGNSDNVVDGSDFLLWQRQQTVPPAPPIASVPEPSSSLLALASAAALGLFRQRSRA